MKRALAALTASGLALVLPTGSAQATAGGFLPRSLPRDTNLVVCADGAEAGVWADGRSFRTALLRDQQCAIWSVGVGRYQVGVEAPALGLRHLSVIRAPGEEAEILTSRVRTWVTGASKRPSLGPHDTAGHPTGKGINVTLVIARYGKQAGGGTGNGLGGGIGGRAGAVTAPDAAPGDRRPRHHRSCGDPGFDPSNDPARRNGGC